MRRVQTVVVDPGHGGHDPGALGVDGLREKDVNLGIARALATQLRARGFVALRGGAPFAVGTAEYVGMSDDADGGDGGSGGALGRLANASFVITFLSIFITTLVKGFVTTFRMSNFAPLFVSRPGIALMIA